MTRLTRLLAACALAALPAAAAPAQSVPFDSGFSGVELRWKGSGRTSVFYTLREQAGQTLVCGFFFDEGAVSANDSDTLLRRSRLKAGRQTVMNDLAHFTRIAPDTPPRAVQAACKPSRRAWQDSYASAELRLRPPVGGFQ